MASLNGAVTLAEVDDVAMSIREDLHFDVPRPVDEFLHVEPRIAEGRFGLSLGGLEEVFQLVWRGDQAHAAATPTCCGFDHHWVAHSLRQLSCFFWTGEQALATWHSRNTDLLHGRLSGRLVSHGADCMG